MGILSRAMYSTANFLRKVGKNISAEDRARNALLKKWREGDKVNNYRYTYPNLRSKSVILDLGGYKGDWASHIYSKYLGNIFVFEPHPDYYKIIKDRFSRNDAIQVYNFGLGATDLEINLGTDADASSAFHSSGSSVPAKISEYGTFLNSVGLSKIDLVKINIEGGEYDLMDYILDNDLAANVENFQIQFHDFVPDAERRMKAIQSRLEKTHTPTYSFSFFWENWERK